MERPFTLTLAQLRKAAEKSGTSKKQLDSVIASIKEQIGDETRGRELAIEKVQVALPGTSPEKIRAVQDEIIAAAESVCDRYFELREKVGEPALDYIGRIFNPRSLLSIVQKATVEGYQELLVNLCHIENVDLGTLLGKDNNGKCFDPRAVYNQFGTRDSLRWAVITNMAPDPSVGLTQIYNLIKLEPRWHTPR